MLTASRTVRRLRVIPETSDNKAYRYCVATIGCSSQGSLYTIEVTSPIDYSTDPGVQIYVFSNPKAAQYFIEENIDEDFVWPEMEKRLKYAPDYNTLMPEAHIVCAGKAKYDSSSWIYPAPVGINSASTDAEHGHAYITETAEDGFTGPMAQGYLTVVVLFPTGSTLFADYEDDSKDVYMLEEVRKCSNCGHFGTDVKEHTCPKCGTTYACSNCDYVGPSNICPNHNTACNAVTLNNSVLYSISAPVSITVQFINE